MADGKIIIETDLDNKGIKDGISKISGIAKTGIKGTLTAIASAGTALTGLGGVAIKVGMDFESAFAGVKKTVDATPEQLEQIRTSLLNLSKQIPLTATEIAGIAEAAGQLGIKTENIEKFTRVMADMGVATNLTSNEAATSLARLANITGMSQDNFDRLGSVIVALGNNLATTESEIVEMGLRLAGAGKQIGLSESQIMSFAGALSSVGIEAEAGGSAFSTLMVNMQLACETGSDKLQDFASVAGMSADEFKEAFEKDASVAILTFVQGLATCDEKGMSAVKVLDDMGIKEIRLRDALLRASGASDVFSESLRIGTDAWKENNALTKEAEQRYETTESKVILLKNTLSALGTELYDSVNTPIRTVIDSATSMVEQLTKAFKNGGLSGLVSELGTVFAEVATQAANSAPKMIDAAVSMIQSFLLGIQNNSDKIANAAVKIGTALVNGLITIVPQIAQVGVDLIAALASSILGSDIGSSVASIGSSIINAFKSILQAVSTVIDTLKPLLSGVITVITKIADAVLGTLCKAIDFLTDNIKIILPLITGVATAFVAWKIIQTVSKNMQAANTAISAFNALNTVFAKQLMISTGAITAKQVVVGVLTGKIKLATLAEMAWNAIKLVNPWVGIGIAVAAVAGGIMGLIACLSGENTEHGKIMKAIEKEKEARNELYEEQQKTLNSNLTEINRTDELNKELKTLVDTNGKVKEGYEKRANYIMTELNSALGTEMTMVNGVMIGYGKLTDQLTSVIDQSKSWNDELKTLVDSNGKIKQGEEERAKTLTEKLNEAMKTNYQITGDTITNYGKLSASVDAQIGKNQSLVQELGTLVDENGKVKEGQEERVQFILNALKEATGIEIELNNGVIQSYQGVQTEIDKTIAKKKAAIIVESYDKVYKNALENYQATAAVVKQYEDEISALENEAANEKDVAERNRIGQKIAQKKAEYESKKELANGYLDDMAHVERMQTQLASGTQKDIDAILAQGVASYDENGKLIVKTVEERLKGEQKTLEMFQEKRKNATEKADQEAYDAQIEASQSRIQALKDEMEAKTSTMTAGMDKLLKSQIALVDASGQSFQLSFEELMAQAEAGIKNGEAPCDLAMQENMTAIVTAISGAEMSVEEKTKTLIDLQTKSIKDKSPEAADAQKRTMGSIIQAIVDKNPEMASAMQALIEAGLVVIDSPQNKTECYDSTSEISSMAAKGLEVADTALSGENFLAGFKNALASAASKNSGIYKLAAEVGLKAVEGLNFGAGNASPSKKTKKSGKYFVDGFVIAVKNNTKEAVKASVEMGQTAVEGLSEQINKADISQDIVGLFETVPEQEIKVVGILDKIKNLNASGLVQRIKAEVMSSQARAGMAFAARAGSSNNNVTNNVTNQPIINFNQPVESPDTTARAINRMFTYGLAGDHN